MRQRSFPAELTIEEHGTANGEPFHSRIHTILAVCTLEQAFGNPETLLMAFVPPSDPEPRCGHANAIRNCLWTSFTAIQPRFDDILRGIRSV